MSPRKRNRDKEKECVREDRASIGRILSATRVKKLGNDLGIFFFFLAALSPEINESIH